MQSKTKACGWVIFLTALFLHKFALLKNGIVLADPARDLATAYNIVEGVSYPLIGMLQGGHLHVGPLYFYVLALPLFISKSIMSVLILVSLVQLMGLIYSFYWGRLFFDKRIAYVLTVLMSVDILSNFPLWQVNNTDFIFPIGAAFAYHLSRAILHKEERHLLIGNFLFIIAVQLHPLFLIFLPSFVYAHAALSGGRKRILGMSFLFLALAMSPWCYYQVRQGFPAFVESFNYTKYEIIPIPFLKTLVRIPELMFKQVFCNPYILWGLSQKLSSPIKYAATALLLLISILSLFGTVLGLIEIGKKRSKGLVLIFSYILLLWFTIPFLRNLTMYWYYLPVQLMWMSLAAFGFVNVTDRIRLLKSDLFQKSFLVTFLLLIGVSQVYVFGTFERRGSFNVSHSMIMSLIDLKRPFVTRIAGQKEVSFLYVGILNQEALAHWAARLSDIEKCHGAILQDLSLSRNALYRKRNVRSDVSKGTEHYVGILKSDLTAHLSEPRIVAEIGAMRILKVNSIMERPTMSYVEQKGWFEPGFDDEKWPHLRLPVYTIENPVEYPPSKKERWRSNSLFLRMRIQDYTGQRPLMIGVSFPSWDPFEEGNLVESAYLNGVPVMNFKRTPYGWFCSLDPFQIAERNNLVALKLRLTKTSDLDVYGW